MDGLVSVGPVWVLYPVGRPPNIPIGKRSQEEEVFASGRKSHFSRFQQLIAFITLLLLLLLLVWVAAALLLLASLASLVAIAGQLAGATDLRASDARGQKTVASTGVGLLAASSCFSFLLACDIMMMRGDPIYY